MTAPARRISAFQDGALSYVQPNTAVYSFARFDPRSNKVRVKSLRSGWMDDLMASFNELTSLPVGWDGYRGKPVSFTCAQFAANIIENLCDPELPPPSLVPGSDGTLQIEWHRNLYDIELDVLGPYQVVATRFDRLTEKEEELELDSDFTDVAVWLSDLKRDRRVVA